MKRIALIHTVKIVLNTFENQLRKAMPKENLKIHNLFDDFLATDPRPDEKGVFTVENKQRLFYDVCSAVLTGADVIVVTCSTLSPTVLQIRPFITVPIIPVDEVMIQAAVAAGNRIKVLATAKSTVEPTQSSILAEAIKLNKKVDIEVQYNEEAYKAMKNGDMITHDSLLKEDVTHINSFDAIVLAQASMAHLEKDIQMITGIPTFSSPNRCIKQIKKVLGV